MACHVLLHNRLWLLPRQVAASMHIVYSPANNACGDKARTYIRIVLDHAAIAAQYLEMDAHAGKDAILRTPKLKLKADGVRTPERDVVGGYGQPRVCYIGCQRVGPFSAPALAIAATLWCSQEEKHALCTQERVPTTSP